MEKFNRNYRAVFWIGKQTKGAINSNITYDDKIEITLPYSVDFDVKAGVAGQPNVGLFQFYNLSETDRAKLWFDLFNRSEKTIKMEFYAGYGKNLEDLILIFSGRVQECTSYRDSGSVDNITSIEVMGGAGLFTTGYANATFNKGTPYANAIEAMLNSIPETKIGYLTEDLPVMQRNQTFLGQTIDLIRREFSGYEIFEDRGEVHILKEFDILPGQLLVISESTGLLGTPRVGGQYLEVNTIFEPGVRCGQIVYLSTEFKFIKSQTYKVQAIHHKGTISPVSCGNLTTSLSLYMGDLKHEWKRLNKKVEQYQIKKEETPATSKGWIKPVQGNITSPFHEHRKPPKYKKDYFHDALDVGANQGTPIKCPYNGTVVSAYYNGGYGNYILINHGQNAEGVQITSAYGHLSKFNVASNQKVYQGDVIGYVGNTGNSFGAHLHFEVMENGRKVNPNKYVGNW